MAYITKKSMTDDILNLVEKFSRADDSRRDETWIGSKIDEVCAQLKVAQYQETGQVDQSWFTDLGVKTFYQVNFSDDPSVPNCCFDISKCSIPNIVSITSKYDTNIDLGLQVLSTCGTKEYTFLPLSSWKSIPKEHPYSKFPFYARINTALYVNKKVNHLRVFGVLAHPEDGYIINSSPVTSGSIVSGTTYEVTSGVVVYNGVPYNKGEHFDGGVTTIFSGNGVVVRHSQLTALSETQPYPCTAEMARQIVLEICTKEFKIESLQMSDKVNNSVDDQQ